MKRFFSFVFLVLFLCSAGRAQTVVSRVKIDSLNVGDVIQYVLTVNKDREYDQVIFPDSAEFAPTFEIRSKKIYRPSAFADSILYELQFFGSENGFVPNVPVGFVSGKDTSYVLAEKAPFYFKSLLKEDEKAEFRPLKPIFAFARAWWPFLVAGIAVLTLLYFLYRLNERRKANALLKPAVVLPVVHFDNPLVQLENALFTLKNGESLSTGQFKDFYSALSEAIRLYFERVYEFPALEQTSGELVRELKRQGVDLRLLELANKVLRASDMVKFAKFIPSYDSAVQHLQLAFDLHKIMTEIDGPTIERMKQEFESGLSNPAEAGK